MYTSITLKLLLGSAAELTPFDLIYFLILGGILETPIYDPDITIWTVLYALLLWGGWVLLINYTIKKTFLEQLRAMLRQNGCFTLRDVNYAILEIDGNLSLIRKDQRKRPITEYL